MDLKSELKDSVAEAKKAKATQDFWVEDARKKANSHDNKKNIWIILIIVLSLTIGGLFTEYLAVVTNYISSIYGWFNLEAYTLYVSAGLIVLGIVRIVQHINQRNDLIKYASQIESMSLTSFRHTYM